MVSTTVEQPIKLTDLVRDLKQQVEDLKDELENMTQEKDEQYDRAEQLEEKYGHISEEDAEWLNGNDLDSMREVYNKWINDELIEKSEDDARRIEIGVELRLCYERLNLGVNTEIDEILKLTNELIELQ